MLVSMTPRELAQDSLATLAAERDQQPDAYWVGWLEQTLKFIIMATEED